VEYRKSLTSDENQTPAIQPVARRYIDRTIPNGAPYFLLFTRYYLDDQVKEIITKRQGKIMT
jgi:hypothetical protein